MKKKLIRFTAIAFAVALMAPASLLAQKDEKDKDKEVKEKKEDKDKNDKKESDQFIITRNSDNKDKVVIEINGDNITVNGKPIDDFKDGDLSIHHSKIKTNNSFNYNYSYDFPKGFMASMDNRAMLGVTTEKAEQGVEVNSVTKESAAEKVGIKEGDVITKIDDTKIEESDDLSGAIQKHKPGEKVTVTFLRDKKEQKVTAELGKWKGVTLFNSGTNNYKMDMAMPRMENFPRTRITGNGQSWNWAGGGPKLGLSVQDTDEGKGVKVIDVDEEGTANKAGVKQDDVITEVDGKAVNGTDDITKIMRDSKDKQSIMLKLTRAGKVQNVEVKMPHKIKTADL